MWRTLRCPITSASSLATLRPGMVSEPPWSLSIGDSYSVSPWRTTRIVHGHCRSLTHQSCHTARSDGQLVGLANLGDDVAHDRGQPEVLRREDREDRPH